MKEIKHPLLLDILEVLTHGRVIEIKIIGEKSTDVIIDTPENLIPLYESKGLEVVEINTKNDHIVLVINESLDDEPIEDLAA